MAVKTYKPITPGQRFKTTSSFEEITRTEPEKSLLAPLKKTGGRNNNGRITSRRRGGGHRRHYRIIDFKRNKFDIPARVDSIEYDPNRSANIALLVYADGEKRYILAPHKLVVGSTIISSENAPIKVGNSLMLENIPAGTIVHNIEMKPGKGGQIVRSAGSSAKLVSLEGDYAQIQLPSSEIRLVPKNIYVTIGAVSNGDHSNIKIGQAGRKRRMGKRPQVRGKVMNPCDHPHGGGEGGCPIGMKYPKTPWGAHALGKKTRNNKSTDKWILKRRSKKRR